MKVGICTDIHIPGMGTTDAERKFDERTNVYIELGCGKQMIHSVSIILLFSCVINRMINDCEWYDNWPID